jgi:hypothetical protein
VAVNPGPPVHRYLEALERELKLLCGVSPEEALSDAREFLQNDWESLARAEPGLDEEAVYAHFLETFGAPEEVALAFAESAAPRRRLFFGRAPGWRICCTKCGRSAPAAKAAITRIGAFSFHKYTLGFCRECRRLRWLRIIKDEGRANLTQLLGASTTAAGARRTLHRPWLVLAVVLALLPILLVVAAKVVERDALPRAFRDLPDGWTVQKSIVVPAGQRDAIGRRLGGRLVRLTNTVVAKHGQAVQINTVECATDQSAQRVDAALRQGKVNQRLVHRSGRTVFEFVARNQEQVRLAIAARYELGIQPPRVTYRVSFDAAPLDSGDAMLWNRLLNLFLQLDRGESASATRAEIAELSQGFAFGDRLKLRRHGQGKHKSTWSFTPKPVEASTLGGGEINVYRFENLPQKAGISYVSVTGTITSETGAFTPSQGESLDGLTAATAHWPADDREVRRLAAQITAGRQGTREKMKALLRWLEPGENVRFGGTVVGSRYGVPKVLAQRFGHCWDFSDLFVTLCRAADVPCRQVLGWLHGMEGHVWAEVFIDGEGWRQVDPTAGADCGSDYVPYLTSENGEVPLVYVSAVRIEVVPTANHDAR